MKTAEVIQKAKEQERLRRCLLERRSTKSIFCFLAAKGLLISPNVTPKGGVKIRILDCIEVGEKVEPRVLEVLPAAILRFPRSFPDLDSMPSDLQDILRAIRDNKEHGPDFRGVRYEDAKRWANIELTDARCLPVRDRRRMKSFRLRPKILALLTSGAKRRGVSETEYLEQLVEAQPDVGAGGS